MDTARLLDLFNAPAKAKQNTENSGAEAEAKAVTSGVGGSAKAVLQNLQELWDTSQYEEFQMENFVQQIKQ